jgi:UDP-3-O-[3-hydroxymyristoyl] glucosamine N-acyltransferase
MTAKSKVALGDLFPELGLIGSFDQYRSLEILRISPLESAGPGSLVFVAQDKYLPLLKEGAPAAAVVSESLYQAAVAQGARFPLLCSRDAMLAMAKSSRFFSTEPVVARGVHPTAVVHPAAKVAADACIGPFCQVGEGAEIGSGAVLQAQVNVGARAKVGAGSVLFPGVVVYQDCELGARVRVHANSVIGADGFGYVQERTPTGVRHVKIHHTGRVLIGDDTEIGACSAIDRGTVGDTLVGPGCIIDNHVQIGHNCKLGRGVVVCGRVGIAGSAELEDFAVVAGAAGIGNKYKIGKGAQVSAFAGVMCDVPPGETWSGFPARPHRQWLKMQAYMRKLPELFGKSEITGKEKT